MKSMCEVCELLISQSESMIFLGLWTRKKMKQWSFTVVFPSFKADIQKLLRYARKLPEKLNQFYKVCAQYSFLNWQFFITLNTILVEVFSKMAFLIFLLGAQSDPSSCTLLQLFWITGWYSESTGKRNWFIPCWCNATATTCSKIHERSLTTWSQ